MFNEKRKSKLGKKLVGIVVILGITGFVNVGLLGNNGIGKSTAAEAGHNNVDSLIEYFQAATVEPQVEDRIEFVEIAALGDFLMHMGVINSAYDYNTGTYDFTNNLEYIKDELSRADITIANIETTFNGAASGYSGYPAFNCPDELAIGMKESGIDIVNNISNHSLDRGASGFIRTREVLLESGLDVIGSRDSEEDDRYIIKEVNDISIGII